MIKRLSACIREYKKQTILTPVCMVGEVVCECTIPLLTADLINAIQNGCTMQTILSFGLKLFAVSVGAVIYYIVLQIVLQLGLNTNDLKLITALIVALFLSVPYWKGKMFRASKPGKTAAKGEKENA